MARWKNINGVLQKIAGSVRIDQVLNKLSRNAISNKAVSEKFEEVETNFSAIDTNVSAIATNTANKFTAINPAVIHDFFTAEGFSGTIGRTIPTYTWWYATLMDTKVDANGKRVFYVKVDIDMYVTGASSTNAVYGWDLYAIMNAVASQLNSHSGQSSVAYIGRWSREKLFRMHWANQGTVAGEEGFCPTVLMFSQTAPVGRYVCLSRRYEASNNDGGWQDNIIAAGTSFSFSAYWIFR